MQKMVSTGMSHTKSDCASKNEYICAQSDAADFHALHTCHLSYRRRKAFVARDKKRRPFSIIAKYSRGEETNEEIVIITCRGARNSKR